MSTNKKTENWNTNLGVVLAVAGSAIGFGNFLRFPGLAAQYGGGAFMIAYFTAFLLLGIPLSWVEWAIGRKGGTLGGHSTASIFYLIGGKARWKYLGVAGVVSTIGIAMYYIPLESWTIGYAWHTAMGDLNLSTAGEYGNFFANYVGLTGDGSLFFGGGSQLVFFALAILANMYVIFRGIGKGIEWFCKCSMPVLLITAFIILARVLTLGTPDATHPERSVSQGLGYMWNPTKTMLVVDGKEVEMVPAHATAEEKTALVQQIQTANPGKEVTEKHISLTQGLLNPEMWLTAAGQVFFSLSIGFGTVCSYASYVRRRKDIALSSLTANAANEAIEVGLAGMMIIPAAVALLGVVAAAGCGTFGLGFNVLPQVFHCMPGGQFFGTLFFVLLFIGAITSAISMLQPSVAFLEEFWNLRRVQSVALVAFLVTVGTLMVGWFTEGLMALDTMDFWFGTMFLYLTSCLFFTIFNVVWGTKNGVEELKVGATIPLPPGLGFIIRWVTPGILLTIFASWLYQNIFVKQSSQVVNLINGEPGAVIPVAWVVLVTIFFCFVIFTSPNFHKNTNPDDFNN